MYPTSTPSFSTPSSSETLQAAGHTALHIAEEANIIAFSNKIGTGASTPTAGVPLVGTGAGTSAWQPLSLTTGVSGILPVSSGGSGASTSTGTGSNVLNNGPTLANPVETGGTYNSATINTPTINYNSGSIPSSALAPLSITTSQIANNQPFPTITYNPYKFSVYRNTSLIISPATIVFDAKSYDTGANYSTSTGIFTAPISGFYQFNASMMFTLYASGSDYGNINFNYNNGTAAGGSAWAVSSLGVGYQVSASVLQQMSAGDTMRVTMSGTRGDTIATGVGNTYFQGFLVSAT